MLSCAAYKSAPSWEVDLGMEVSACVVFRLHKAGEKEVFCWLHALVAAVL